MRFYTNNTCKNTLHLYTTLVHIKAVDMLIISTRDFREKQGECLRMVKNGKDTVLKSRNNGSFIITPITDDDSLVKREHILAPDNELARAITMDELLLGVKDDLREMFRKGDQ